MNVAVDLTFQTARPLSQNAAPPNLEKALMIGSAVGEFQSREQLTEWLREDWHQITQGEDADAPTDDDEFVAS